MIGRLNYKIHQPDVFLLFFEYLLIQPIQSQLIQYHIISLILLCAKENRSLFGDHYVHGMEGVRFYTRLKTITARWPSGIRAGTQFHFKSGAEH